MGWDRGAKGKWGAGRRISVGGWAEIGRIGAAAVAGRTGARSDAHSRTWRQHNLNPRSMMIWWVKSTIERHHQEIGADEGVTEAERDGDR